MKSSTPEPASIAQAVVAGDLDDDATLTGRAGASEFPIGSPDGRGGTTSGANPYDPSAVEWCRVGDVQPDQSHRFQFIPSDD